MSRALTAPEVLADKLIVDAIKTLVATYQQTKLVSGSGIGTGRTIDFRTAERILAQRALKKTYRGNAGFSGDISSIGQVP